MILQCNIGLRSYMTKLVRRRTHVEMVARNGDDKMPPNSFLVRIHRWTGPPFLCYWGCIHVIQHVFTFYSVDLYYYLGGLYPPVIYERMTLKTWDGRLKFRDGIMRVECPGSVD